MVEISTLDGLMQEQADEYIVASGYDTFIIKRDECFERICMLVYAWGNA